MSKSIAKTGERIAPEHIHQSREAYIEYLRHYFAYDHAKTFLSKQTSVIEVGCGEGYGTSYLSQYVDHIVGVDIDREVIHHAAEKYGSAHCSFNVYDGIRLPYDTHIFDVALSFQVIEHVKNEKQYLAEIARVLKAEGYFLLTTPNGKLRLKPNHPPWNRFHIREYSPNELKELLRSIFTDVRIWGIRGNEEIQRLEKTRIMQAQRFAALAPLKLRKYLPPALEKWLVTMIKQILRGKQNTHDSLTTYQLDDFSVTRNNVEESLDLFAICKRHPQGPGE